MTIETPSAPLTAEEAGIAWAFLNQMTRVEYKGKEYLVLANIMPDGRVGVTVGALDGDGSENDFQFRCRQDGTDFEIIKGTDEDIRDFLVNYRLTLATVGSPVSFG